MYTEDSKVPQIFKLNILFFMGLFHELYEFKLYFSDNSYIKTDIEFMIQTIYRGKENGRHLDIKRFLTALVNKYGKEYSID